MPVTNYVWDPLSDNVLLETDENDVTQAVYTQEPDTFGNLISQRRNDETSWYHFDGLGSTRELTNASETVTDANMYDAWGVNVASTGTTENPFRWVGELGYCDDPKTGDYYVRARTYQPKVGRWNSQDPVWAVFVSPFMKSASYHNTMQLLQLASQFSDSPDLHMFRYAGSRPTSTVDPSGLFCEPRDPCVEIKLDPSCAKLQANYRTSRTAPATTLGNLHCGSDGEAHPVIWNRSHIQQFFYQNLKKCAELHEREHIKQLNAQCPAFCKCKDNQSIPDPQTGMYTVYRVIGGIQTSDGLDSECAATLVGIKCMRSVLQAKNLPENTRVDIELQIRFQLERYRQHNCIRPFSNIGPPLQYPFAPLPPYRPPFSIPPPPFPDFE